MVVLKPAKHILPIIVIAQFCCTSLWFAGNAVISDLIFHYSLADDALANLTSSVQFGFILGTLLFAMLAITDRYSPSMVFFCCALLGAFFNVMVVRNENSYFTLLALRFLTGLSLAGIYPVGMKIAADYYDKSLGKSLGFLVGALVLGTAFPHLLQAFAVGYDWQYVIIATSIIAVAGGSLILFFVPNGPFRKRGTSFNALACFKVFKNVHFRKAALGYFGHMWELYTFWAFVPIILITFQKLHPESVFDISTISFVVIAIGALGCILSGYLSQTYGAKKIATAALLVSCVCCSLSPFFFQTNSTYLFILFLLIWGISVIADSPLFSTLVAQNVNGELKGSALTIVNCIGFAITIFSIQFLTYARPFMSISQLYLLLSIGPVIGLLVLIRK